MTFLFRLLPTLLLGIFALAFAAQNAAPAPNNSEDDSIQALRQQIRDLSDRLDRLEAERHHVVPRGLTSGSATTDAGQHVSTSAAAPIRAPLAEASGANLLAGTAVGFGVDGYYGYNFNAPVGRVNLLRAYDVGSNSFNLNQASLIVAPGFVARAEYRRDWSNQRYFLTDTAATLAHAQTTATLGLIYWWGTKQDSW